MEPVTLAPFRSVPVSETRMPALAAAPAGRSTVATPVIDAVLDTWRSVEGTAVVADEVTANNAGRGVV